MDDEPILHTHAGDGAVLISAPHVSDVLAGGLVLLVKALVVVVLGIGVLVDEGLDALALDQPHTLNHMRSVLLQDPHDGEGVADDSLRALHEAVDQVPGHHGHGVVRVVLVLGLPQGIGVGVVVLPEPRHGHVEVGHLFVVLALPHFKVEVRLGHISEGVLLGSGGGDRSRSGGSSLLLLLLLLLLLTGLLLLLAALLGSLAGTSGGTLSDHSLHAENELAEDFAELGLVDAGVEPALHSGVLGAGLSIEHQLHGVGQHSHVDDVSQGDGVADQVSVVAQALIQHLQGAVHISDGLLGEGSVELGVAEDGVDPHHNGELKLMGSEVHPSVHLAALEEGNAVQVGVTANAGNVPGDGVALEQRALGGVKDGDLAKGVLLQEGGGLGGGHIELGGLDGHIVVLGSNEGLQGAEVAREGVEGLW